MVLEVSLMFLKHTNSEVSYQRMTELLERAVLASAFVPPDSQLGAALGLGAESNVENAKKGKRPFFNWINADDKIATARGGGGGLALVETCHGRRRIKNKDNDRCILGPFRKRFSI